jgi:uncharacterized protein (TIGR02284 family)
MRSTSNQIKRETLDTIQDVIRTNLVSRDGLYAAAAKLDGQALRRICTRLADELGGNVADLQQLLLARGQKPVGPDDELVRKLRAVVLEVLQQQPSPQHIVAEAEECARVLKKEYDAALTQTDDPQIKNVLHRQRQEAEFGGDVLGALEEVHRPGEQPRQPRSVGKVLPASAARKKKEDKPAQANPQPSDHHKPQVGETYRCEKCGMRIEVTAECNCTDDVLPEFRCCGAEMTFNDPSVANDTLTPEAARGDYTG